MFRLYSPLNTLRSLNSHSVNIRLFSLKSDLFHVKEEVRTALEYGKPVVALESTIITHGMPYPRNVECALGVEENIRKQVGKFSFS